MRATTVAEGPLRDLLPLVGRWSGTARVTPPGRHPIELRHTERVATRSGGTILTVEGVSYPTTGGDEPVFSAFAVVCAGEHGPRWHAYSRGEALDTALGVGPGRFGWDAPGPAPTCYRAEFDDEHWHETGRLVGSGEIVFTMDLARTSGRAAARPPGPVADY